MKSCELCNSPARMYCESDQANLCWKCDSKVHGANFLVARHCRSLLCHVCQCQTPWSTSGVDFGPTMSACRRCTGEGAEEFRTGAACEESGGGNEVEVDSQDKRSFEEEDVDEEDEMSDSDDEDDDEDGDIQVVPWSSTTPPPPATSSSSSEEYSSGSLSVADGGSPIPSLKRARGSSSDLCFQQDLERWRRRSRRESDRAGDGADYLRPLKGRRTEPICKRRVDIGPA